MVGCVWNVKSATVVRNASMIDSVRRAQIIAVAAFASMADSTHIAKSVVVVA
jgi:hypothetical protein